MTESCVRFIVAVIAVLAVACKSSSTDQKESPTTATWSVAAQPLLSLGELDGNPAYVFSRIADVRFLNDNRIAVADGASGTVRLYDANGEFERQVGGVGRGPGEFRYLTAVKFQPPDTILAYDSRDARLNAFLLSGAIIDAPQFRAPDGVPEAYIGRYSDGTHVLAWIRRGPQDVSAITADDMQIGHFGSDGRLYEVITNAPGMRRIQSPVPFSGHFLAAMVGDSVFITDGMSGTIRVMNAAGELLRTLQLGLEDWDPAEAWQRLEAAVGPSQIEQLRQMKAIPGTDSIPSLSDMLTDDEGRLWLKLYDPSTDSHTLLRSRTGGEWIVVRTDGQQLARIRMPDGFRPTDIRDDRVAGVSRDPLGIERVHVYMVNRD